MHFGFKMNEWNYKRLMPLKWRRLHDTSLLIFNYLCSRSHLTGQSHLAPIDWKNSTIGTYELFNDGLGCNVLGVRFIQFLIFIYEFYREIFYLMKSSYHCTSSHSLQRLLNHFIIRDRIPFTNHPFRFILTSNTIQM